MNKQQREKLNAEILAEFNKRQGNITIIYAQVALYFTSLGYKVSPSKVQQVVDKARKGGQQ